jgi:hypothetical protein
LKFEELFDEFDVCEDMLTVSGSFWGVAMAIGADVLMVEALVGVVLADTWCRLLLISGVFMVLAES